MTATNIPPAALIKTDRLGRVRVSKEHREQLLDTFEQSPLSGTRFAELHGIKYQTFATWVQQRKRERGEYENPAKPPGRLLDALIELELPSPVGAPLDESTRSRSPGLVAEHPSGIRVTITNDAEARLAAVLFEKLHPGQPSC